MNRLPFFRHVLALSLCALLLTSCDSGFEEMNVDPTQADEIDLGFQFTTAQLQTAGGRYEMWRANLIYNSTMVQHFATLPTYWAGDKYLYIASYSAAFFERMYEGPAKQIVDIIDKAEEDPELVNLLSAARIWRVLIFHRLTDLYGDIPYSEAGRGFIDGIASPAYDPQQAIYMDMLNELKEAVAAFDPSKETFGPADLVYSGDVAQWQRFGNSLMLRLALRLVKVEPGTAEQWVQEAVNGPGGVMQSNADIAAVPHTAGPAGINRNGNGEVFTVDGSPRLSETFVSFMKERNDPRLPVFGVVRDLGPDGAVQQTFTAIEEQQGMPNGYDATTIQEAPSWVPCPEGNPDPDFLCELEVYSVPAPVLTGEDDPTFFQTYAEVELMLAEAAARGWIDEDPEAHYEAGVRAAMEYLALYGPEAVIPSAEINAYLDANPFEGDDSNEEQLEQINTQYWAATFLNEFEAYANWRRTGYPDLTPVDYPGNVTGGTIPRRLRYPGSEAVQNAENYQAAISRQGPDELTTRVWWDVAQ